MGLETDRKDMVQAILEGVAFLSAELITAMDRATPLTGAISVDGGLSKNPYFCSFLAEALDRPVSVAGSADLTGLGTAQMTLIGAGLATIKTLPAGAAPSRVVKPQGLLSQAGRARFAEAVSRCRNWR